MNCNGHVNLPNSCVSHDALTTCSSHTISDDSTICVGHTIPEGSNSCVTHVVPVDETITGCVSHTISE